MVNVTDEFRSERGRKFVRLIMQDIKDRQTRLAKIRLARALYYGDATPVQGPWSGSSNVHLPVVLEKIEGSVPKCVNAFWGIKPTVQIQRVPDEFLPEETNDTEVFFDWALESDIQDLYPTTENWFRNAHLDGISHVKAWWDKRWRRIVEPWALKKLWDVGDTDHNQLPVEQVTPKTVLDLLVDIFGAPRDGNLQKALLDYQYIPNSTSDAIVEVAEMSADAPELAMILDGDTAVGTKWRVTFLENRRRLWAEVEFTESEFVDEIQARVHRRVLEYDAPRVEVVEYEDLILPFRAPDV